MNELKPEDLQYEYCQKKELPDFAPRNGICYSCRRYIYDSEQMVEKASTELITGCPHCHRSYCN